MNKVTLFMLKLKSNDKVRFIGKFAYALFKAAAIGYMLGDIVGKIVCKVFKTDKSRTIAGLIGILALTPINGLVGKKESEFMQIDYENYLKAKEEFEEEDDMDFEI